jgi:hypothetical protein
MNFSFKKEKVEVVEKYPNNAVLTYVGGEGVKKFSLNKKAVFLLGLEDADVKDRKVSFGPIEDSLLLANTSGVETPNQHVITSDFTFSSAPLAKRIALDYDLILMAGMEFPLLTPDEADAYAYVIISSMKMEEVLEVNDVVTDTTDARSEVASEEENVYQQDEGEIRENAFIEANHSQDPRYGARV